MTTNTKNKVWGETHLRADPENRMVVAMTIIRALFVSARRPAIKFSKAHNSKLQERRLEKFIHLLVPKGANPKKSELQRHCTDSLKTLKKTLIINK